MGDDELQERVTRLEDGLDALARETELLREELRALAALVASERTEG